MIVLTAVLIAAKIILGGQNIRPGLEGSLWRVNAIAKMTGKGERAKARFTLPQDTPRQIIYNENFENDGLDFYVRERKLSGNRMGFWRSELLDGSKTIQYIFSTQLKSAIYNIPLNQTLPKRPYEFYPAELHAWLDPSKFIQSEDAVVKQQLKKLIGKEKNVSIVTRRIFDFVWC